MVLPALMCLKKLLPSGAFSLIVHTRTSKKCLTFLSKRDKNDTLSLYKHFLSFLRSTYRRTQRARGLGMTANLYYWEVRLAVGYGNTYLGTFRRTHGLALMCYVALKVYPLQSISIFFSQFVYYWLKWLKERNFCTFSETAWVFVICQATYFPWLFHFPVGIMENKAVNLDRNSSSKSTQVRFSSGKTAKISKQQYKRLKGNGNAHRQKPMTRSRSVELTYQAYVMLFLQTGLLIVSFTEKQVSSGACFSNAAENLVNLYLMTQRCIRLKLIM